METNTTEHFLLHCGVHAGPMNIFKQEMSRLGAGFTMKEILHPVGTLQSSVLHALETYLVDCHMTDKI